MDIRAYNREAWNRYVDGGESLWTQPVSPEIIEKSPLRALAMISGLTG